jgi:hypothetical protein
LSNQRHVQPVRDRRGRFVAAVVERGGAEIEALLDRGDDHTPPAVNDRSYTRRLLDNLLRSA